MPEFFEVKRIKEYLLDGDIIGKKLLAIEPQNKGERIFKTHNLETLNLLLQNTFLNQIETWAKYTLFYFPKGILVWHYRFTGVPHIKGHPYGQRLQAIHSLPIDIYPSKFVRFTMHFSDETKLYFIDMRCLSHINFYETTNKEEIPLFKQLAPDLMHFPYPSYQKWKIELTHSKTIKEYLQDQTIPPSGIGNYLACEILFRARLNPWLLTSQLTRSQYDRLIMATLRVCEMAQADEGYLWFGVYKRDICNQCAAPIVRKKHQGPNSQTTHFCPSCQKLE